MIIRAIDRLGAGTELATAPGTILMELLRDENLGVEAVCGGNCACATCHVFVDLSRCGPRGPLEEELVGTSTAYDPAQSRLSCQITLQETHDGLTVTIAPEE